MNIEEEAKKIKDRFSSLIKQYKKNEKMKKEGVSLDNSFKSKDEYLNKEIALFFKEYGRFIKTRKNSIGTFSIEDYVSYMKIELQRKGHFYNEGSPKNNYSIFMDPRDGNDFQFSHHSYNLNNNFKSYNNPPYRGEFVNQPNYPQNNHFVDNVQILQNSDYKSNNQGINDSLYRNGRFRGHSSQQNSTHNDFNRSQDIYNSSYYQQNNISPIIYTSKNDLYPTMKFKNDIPSSNDFVYNTLYEGSGKNDKFNQKRPSPSNLQKDKNLNSEQVSSFKEAPNIYKNIYSSNGVLHFEKDNEGMSYVSNKNYMNNNYNYPNPEQGYRRIDRGSLNNLSPGDNFRGIKATKTQRIRFNGGLKNEEYLDKEFKNNFYENKESSPIINVKNSEPQDINSFRERIFNNHKNNKSGAEKYKSNVDTSKKRVIRSSNIHDNVQFNRNIFRDRGVPHNDGIFNNIKNVQLHRESMGSQKIYDKISADKVFYEKKLWENPPSDKINFSNQPYQNNFVNNEFITQGIPSMNKNSSYYYDKYLKSEISISDFINDKNKNINTNYNNNFYNNFSNAQDNRVLQSTQVYGKTLKNVVNDNYKNRFIRTEPIGKPLYDTNDKNKFSDKKMNAINFKKVTLEDGTCSLGSLNYSYTNVSISNNNVQSNTPLTNNKFSSFGYNKIYNNIGKNNTEEDKSSSKYMNHETVTQTYTPKIDVQNTQLVNNNLVKDNEVSGYYMKQAPLSSGFFKQGIRNEDRSFGLSSSTSDDQDKYFLEDLVKEIGATGDINKESRDLLYEICDNFIEHMIVMSNAIACHRNCKKVDVKDIRLAFKSECDFELPDETLLNRSILDAKSIKSEMNSGDKLKELEGKSEFMDKSSV